MFIILSFAGFIAYLLITMTVCKIINGIAMSAEQKRKLGIRLTGMYLIFVGTFLYAILTN